MIYELRTYHAMPGKLNELHARFNDLVVGLLKKHHIEALGFWTDKFGPNNHTVTWMVRFEDQLERDTKFDAFNRDPAWIEGRDRSEANGPIMSHWENRVLSPTAYSPR